MKLSLVFALLASLMLALPSVAHGQDRPNSRDVDERKVNHLFVDACTEMMRGNNEQALALYREVLEADPEHHASMYSIARIALEETDYNTAIEYGRNALKLDPENYWYYQVVQQAYEFKGEFANAIETQEQLIRRFPGRNEARLQLAELYLRNGDPKVALETLDELERRVGAVEEVVLRKYQLLMQLERYPQALNSSEQLLGLDPENPRYYKLQYDTYMAMGKRDEAIAVLEELLQVDAENGFALLSLADYYRERNDVERSDQYLYRAFRNPNIPIDGKVDIIRSLISYVPEQPELLPRVKRLARILEETHPQEGRTLAIRGDIFTLNQQPDSAAMYYRRSLDLDASDPSLWLKLLGSAYQQQDYKQLYRQAEEALEYYPNNEEFLFYFGIGSAAEGDDEAARYAFEKIRKFSSGNRDILVRTYAELGALYQRRGDISLADETFQAGLELSPDDAYLLNSYAYHLALRGERLQDAQRMSKQALSQAPQEPAYLHTRGWVQFQLGNYKEAESLLADAAGARPTPLYLEHYGDVLYRLGKKDEAIVQWKRAIELGAANLNIDRKLNP